MATGDGQIDMQEILRRIPHRYPFLLIDRAEDFVANTSIVGIKGVSANEPFFPGHFPENPVMPGVLIVEALAQAGAILMSKSLEIDATGRTIFLASTDNVRFRSAVRPGVLLHLHVQVLKHRGDVYKFRGVARIDGKDAAEAEWTAMVVDNPA
ncbi:MAG TPA: 3-hydroxyacyl-ACP dehydratase FabZ [Caulobacteraceae bacterium]|jgi:3-hydroxyacyl-[acyl-carrier-protein] dehydratase